MKTLPYTCLLLLAIVCSFCNKAVKPLPAIEEAPVVIKPLVIGDDPFKPYLDSVPVILQTISTTNQGSITIKRFTFLSKGGVNTIYGILAYPQAAGTYPAILYNHGGGGNAETQLGNVVNYANLGYVTLAIDIPAIAGTGNTPNSSGPWKSAAPGEGPRLNVSGGVQNSTLFDAIVGGLGAFNFLRSQANVNPNSMAISGSSWGGYMTTMLSGLLGNKVKAAYSAFGCGYYELGSFWSSMIAAMTPAARTTWLTYLDAGRRAQYITAPYFIEEPTNDTYFWPEAVDATLRTIRGVKSCVKMPNLNHTSIPGAGAMKQLYMNYYLKGIGSAFGTVAITGTVPQGNGSLQVNITATLPAGITATAVKLYYSIPGNTWPNRVWDSVTVTNVSGNNYTANLSAALVSQNVQYFASLVDNRNFTSSSAMAPSVLPVFPNGVYRIVNRNSGLVLDVKSKLTANGSLVQQWAYNGGTNQQWSVTSLGGGQYAIMGVQSGRSLDVQSGLTADTTPVQIYDYSGANNQRWTITPSSGGYYKIKGVQSNKLLEVKGNVTTAGALIQIYTDNNGNHQQWFFGAP